MGEQQADFEAFVASRGAALLRFAFMLTHDRGRAEDLVQEALVKVHRRWDRVVAAEQPEAYVRGIVTHEFLSWRRRRSSEESPGVIPRRPVEDPSAGVDERDAMWISSRSAKVRHRPFRSRPRRGRTPAFTATHPVPRWRCVPASAAAPVMNSPRCIAAQNVCTVSATIDSVNLVINTLTSSGVATTERTQGSLIGTPRRRHGNG